MFRPAARAASAYERVGDVGGTAQFANLGRERLQATGKRSASVSHWRKFRGGSDTDQSALAAVYIKLIPCSEFVNNFSASLDALQRGYAIMQKLAAAQEG